MQLRQEADSQQDYRNQAAVPDFASYFQRWKEGSALAREKVTCHVDVPYGDGWRETCDIFPSQDSHAPVFIFIHGGWFYFLDKSDFSYLAPAYVDRDAVVVQLAYPLAPTANIDEIVTSVEKAVLWTYRNIGQFGGDPNRIYIGGHSAGGHLATMMALRDWERLDAPGDLIKACCSVSGLYDLLPILATPHNDKIKMRRDTAHRASPIRAIRPSKAIFLACVGADELSGFHWQHEQFAAACAQAKLNLVDVSMPGRHHFSVIDALGDPDSTLFKTFWGLMRSSEPTSGSSAA